MRYLYYERGNIIKTINELKGEDVHYEGNILKFRRNVSSNNWYGTDLGKAHGVLVNALIFSSNILWSFMKLKMKLQ